MPIDLASFVLVATEAVPEVGAVAGDSILIRPGHSDPIVVLHRPARATYGELAGVVADGRVECPTLPASHALERLVSLAAATAAPPPRVLPFPGPTDRSA